jgi:peptidoglycan/xylan/chitin deacetylase (PgdA/CDA1 family)
VKLFDRYDIKGAFFVPAWCIERCPATVQAIVDSGNEVTPHGYLQESARDQTREGEFYRLQRSIRVIEQFCGKPAAARRMQITRPARPTYLFREGFYMIRV